MRKLFFAIICVLIPAVSYAQSEPFSVKVVNADHEPVVGAHVIYPSDPTNDTFTDDEGIFTGWTCNGSREYIVEHPDYRIYYGTYLSDSPVQEISLTRSSEPFSIKVVNADNEPVVGAHVIYPSDPANETFTDDEGIFTGWTWYGHRDYIVTHPDYQTYYGTYLSDSPEQEIMLSNPVDPIPSEGNWTFSFKIINQDSIPVSGAHVIVWGHPELEAVVGDDGLYSKKLFLRSFSFIIVAPGYQTYYEDYYQDKWLDTFVLVDNVRFKKGVPATIVLPVAPDTSWGRYFSPDHCEAHDKKPFCYFNRVNDPQANVPYVIIPETDFELNVSDYDRKHSNPIDQSFKYDNYLCGSYYHQRFTDTENWHTYLIDKTPDCGDALWGEVHMGPFRAYFKLGFGFRYGDEMTLVFEGEENGITPIAKPATETSALFDLQGRRIQGQPQRGVYIQDGRKVVMK